MAALAAASTSRGATDVFGWGENVVGQLNTPALDPSQVRAVDCGVYHTYALLHNGTVVGWGDNGSDQIATPADLSGVTQISCGDGHTYALKSDGSIVGWGANGFGQIDTPPAVAGVTRVACGAGHTYALLSDGTLVGWGLGDNGQTSTPPLSQAVTGLECGGYSTYAIHADGSVQGWGGNWWGQTNTPVGLSNVTQMACGEEHSVALRSNGTVVVWGANWAGQRIVPQNAVEVTQIACGFAHTCALKQDGSVVAWGWNMQGQTTVPANFLSASWVAAGGRFSYAIGDLAPDADGDGYSTIDDCDDANPAIHPGAEEVEDFVDNDCNGVVDDYWDHDGDGWIAASDCNDGDASVNPAAIEVCDGVDNNCNGEIDGPCALGGACYDPNVCDADFDGFPDAQDCDPQDRQVHPGATEWCDGKDNDCDGVVDDACVEDCNHDEIPDADQIATEPWFDLDQDGRLDVCQIRDDPSVDCNRNWVLDSFELQYPDIFGTTDCDGNGRIDECDLADDKSTDCNGNGVFDACEIADGYAEDCDLDGVPDACAQYGRVNASSQRLSPFGYTRPQTWTVEPALPGVDGAFEAVTLDMRVRGDFASSGEYFTVYVNGRFAGHVDGGGSFDCNPNGPLSGVDHLDRQLRIPMNVWNYATAAGGGAVAIEFVPSIAVDTNRCPVAKPSYIEATVNYTAALDADCNANGLLDTCEIELAPWVDLNLNGIPDECEGSGSVPPGCPGDLDRSGAVDTGDIALLLLEMNSPAAPGDPLDVDQSGLVDPGDVGLMLLLFGPCS